jgi:metal transporter CNNM
LLAEWARLTLGLMGLDELHLRVLATSSEDIKEKANAQKGVLGGRERVDIGLTRLAVLRLMKRGRHWVLVVSVVAVVLVFQLSGMQRFCCWATS